MFDDSAAGAEGEAPGEVAAPGLVSLQVRPDLAVHAPVERDLAPVELESDVGVDLLFESKVKVLLAEVGECLSRAAVAGECVAAPADPIAFATGLYGHVPNAALVEVLAGLDLADVHDAVLVEAIAGWERITSLAAARQSEVIAELARRRSGERRGEFVGDEVASVLAMTRAVAEAKVGLAASLDQMPAVHDALVAGVIDHRKATAMTDGLGHLPIDVARIIADAVLADAPDLTVPALRARMRKVELTLDPEAVEKRHDRDRSDRHVRLTPAPGAMAWLTALLPADDAMAVFTGIDAIANSADPDDPRGVEERRADALTDVFTHILATGIAPDGGQLRSEQRRRPHLQVTAAATTLLGLDQVPGDLAGYGPIPASMVRAIAADATWRRIFTDPATGEAVGIGPRGYRPGADLTATVIARDRTCMFPGCRMPAWRCDIDHLIPFDHDRPGDDQTTCANLHSLCRHHHRLKTYAGWTVTRDTETGDTNWTSPTKHTYRRPRTDANPDPPRLLQRPAPTDGPPPF